LWLLINIEENAKQRSRAGKSKIKKNG